MVNEYYCDLKLLMAGFFKLTADWRCLVAKTSVLIAAAEARARLPTAFSTKAVFTYCLSYP